MLLSNPRTALRSVARHVSSPSIHARPRPALPPIPIALSPVFSRPNVEALHAFQCNRLFSSSSRASSATVDKVLGVAAALRAQEDDAFQVKPEIFDEFSLKGRVGVVSLANRPIDDRFTLISLTVCFAGLWRKRRAGSRDGRRAV
jgi:hypothetical protein